MAKRSTSPKRRGSSSSSKSSDSEEAKRRQKKREDKEKDREKEREREREREKEKEKEKEKSRAKDREREREKEKDRAKEKERDRGGDKGKDKGRDRRRSSSKRSRSCSGRRRRSRSKKSRSRHRSRSKKSRSRGSRSRKSRSKGSGKKKRSRSRKSRSRKRAESSPRRERKKSSRSSRGRHSSSSRKSRARKSRTSKSRRRSASSKASRGAAARRRSRSKASSKASKRSAKRPERSKRLISARTSSSSSSSAERRKKEKKRQKKEAAEEKSKGGDTAAESSPKAAGATPPPSAKKPLGDLAELQKQLEEERDKLQLFILKAKQEHEEKRETDDRRERREKEYYHPPSWGEPVGPDNRFLLEGEVGKGAFSTVFKCRDALKGGEYAVKFIRMNAMLRKATEKEVKLMRRLRTLASVEDPEGARCFLGLAGPETFEHQGHFAVVFQLQRCDLRSGLQKYGLGKGLPLTTVQCYGSNIFMALRALKKVNIIHSDVKPDNLLITLDKNSVKLSDFGSAMGVNERVKTDYVQPRFYRAPEVILGQAYGTEIDMWSAALTIFELATGVIALQGRTNNGMIHEMLKVNGAFPKKFATSGDFASRHFGKEGEFKCQEPGNGAAEATIPMDKFPKPPQPPQPFQRLLEEHIKEPPPGSDAGRHQARLGRLADLLARCVVPVPAERFTPQNALAHAFFNPNAAK